jgi:hypothetical protein
VDIQRGLYLAGPATKTLVPPALVVVIFVDLASLAVEADGAALGAHVNLELP